MAFFIYTFDPLVAALYNAAYTPFTLRTIIVILLGIQLGLREEYDYPSSYVDRIFPANFRPYANSSNILLRYQTFSDNACERAKLNISIQCDFIVVGSGAAGSTIASRLSENPSVTVCLVEAGWYTSTESVVPQFFIFGINNTAIWRYKAERVNTSSNAFKDGCGCIFGKQLGGSTGTNAMVYVCGNDRDYNYWESLGNTDWGYKSVLPFMKLSEHNLNSTVVGNGTYHGTKGPLYVESTPGSDPINAVIIAAWNQLGYKTIPDYNAQDYNGVVELQSTIYLGERMNAWRAFLSGVYKDRPNLKIFLNSQVTKVIFADKKAIGVNIRTNNSECLNIQLIAKKEVILSGGTYGTTKIMLQSGLGRLPDLQPHGIAQVADLNVGHHFIDHVYGMIWVALNPSVAGETIVDVLSASLNYFGTRNGPFSQSGSLNCDAFINLTDPTAPYPDVQYAFLHIEKQQQFLAELLADINLKDEFIAKLLALNRNYQLIAIEVVVLKPYSTGRVELRSSDPLDTPKITTGYLTDVEGRDKKLMIAGINKLKALLNTTSFKATQAHIVDFNICTNFPLFSDSYLECYVTYFTANLWHQSGTCKMGNSSDPDAVVDPKLNVYNVTNLRVCDTSIYPTMPSGNTQCPTYMVGERCADFIKKTWGL